MTIPFLDIFKRARARFAPTPEPVVAVRPVEKATSERLTRTVMPNASRAAAAVDPFKTAADSAPNIKLPGIRPSTLPPTVMLALQPKVERAISLQLRDILDQLPAGYVKPVEQFDSSQPILFKASEIEKGMSTGKPTVLLASIYEQVPSIFLRNVGPNDQTNVDLPFNKVLDQFKNVQLRDDQEKEYEVPQLDTPILQATIEDTQRFGTAMPAVQTTSHPPVRVEPATARTISSAEPEPVSTESKKISVAPKGIPLNLSTSPTVTPPPTPAEPVSPTRIPFVLPPNGTGGSASEKVPASNGPSVPTPTPPPADPARIPFKLSMSGEELKSKDTTPGPAIASSDEKEAAAPVAAPSENGEKISLQLRAVLQNMPAFQLKGSADAVPVETRVELPLALVESQLASGRIAVPAKVFRAALAQNDRDLVVVDDGESPVLLPLQEVLKNLPSTVLKMRADQEEEEATSAFETPFSIKAAEDAKRFVEATPIEEKKPETPKAEVAPPEAPAVESNAPKVETETPAPAATAEKKTDSEVTVENQVEEKGMPKIEEKVHANTNAKSLVARAAELAGVAGCSVTFEDGLSLAGNLPDDVQVGGLCAMAPSVLQRINRHTVDTKLGPLKSMTLHCRESQMSFFMKGSVCLTVLHAGGDLAADTHDQLAEMANELSRIYSQPETVHVDH
jgi:predicted regulator of Ras-like GTPase activity (Roadblock/LC7/MglB family)